MNYKKKIIILVCSVWVYLGLIFLYSRLNTHDYKEAYVLKKDLLRGEWLKQGDFEKVYIKSNDMFFNSDIFLLNENEQYVLNKDLSKGGILLKDHLISNSEYTKASQETEIISIKISNPEDIVSYQIEKNSVVNLYYTGNLELAKDILEELNLPFISTKQENISRVDSKYITMKLVENLKVINIFDKYGNVIESGKHLKNETNKIDTIMFEVNKNLVMKINNLKNYGQFSISIIR